MTDLVTEALTAELELLTEEITSLEERLQTLQLQLQMRKLEKVGVMAALARRAGPQLSVDAGAAIEVEGPASASSEGEDSQPKPPSLVQAILNTLEAFPEEHQSASLLLSRLGEQGYRCNRATLNSTLHDLRRQGRVEKKLRGAWSLPSPSVPLEDTLFEQPETPLF